MSETAAVDAPELPEGAPAPAVRIVNQTEMAELLGITVPTLREWVRKYDLPVQSRGSHGTAYEFDVVAVKAWQQRHQADMEAEAEARREQLRETRVSLFGDDLDDDPTAGLSPTERRAEIEAQKAADLLRLQRGELLRRVEVDSLLRTALAEMTKGLRQIAPDVAREHGLDRDVRIAIDNSVRKITNATLARMREVMIAEADSDAA